MDGVSWSTARTPESFSRSRTATETLSRLASLIARADTKQHVHAHRQRLSHLPAHACSECGKTFPYALDLLQHQELKHSLPKPHRCPSCGQEFSLRSSLQLHKCDGDSSPCELCGGESRHGSPCLSCAHRPMDPSRPQDKSLHLQPHLLDSSPYACAPCGRGFSQKQALLQHQQAGCSEPPRLSEMVDAGSLPDDSPPVSEGDTTRSDSSDTPGPSCGRAGRACQFCSRSFRTEAGLRRHKQWHHPEEQFRAQQRLKTKGERTGVVTRGGGYANKHPNQNSKPKQKLLQCRSCDMVFRSTSKLYMHRKEKHSRDKSTGSDLKPVAKRRWKGDGSPCHVCGKVFFHHLSLKAHYRWHTASSFSTGQAAGSAAQGCKSQENRSNNVKSNLKDKMRRPAPGRSRKESALEIRESDVRRCREVPEEREVEKEEEVEEEEREFPCPSCAEVFSLHSQLREHMELHQSSVKRRQCSVCTNEMHTCKWPGSKRHRLYHCVPCQQGFSAMDSFLEHCQKHLQVRVEEDSLTEGYVQQAGKA